MARKALVKNKVVLKARIIYFILKLYIYKIILIILYRFVI